MALEALADYVDWAPEPFPGAVDPTIDEQMDDLMIAGELPSPNDYLFDPLARIADIIGTENGSKPVPSLTSSTPTPESNVSDVSLKHLEDLLDRVEIISNEEKAI